jgi:hypothetical protein
LPDLLILFNGTNNTKIITEAKKIGVNTIIISNEKKDLKNVIIKVNIFFDEDWVKFKSSLETVYLSPFKKIETFEIIE